MKAFIAVWIEDGMPLDGFCAYIDKTKCETECIRLKAIYDIDAEVAQIEIVE